MIIIIMYCYIIKISRGIEPLKKVLTVPRINHSAMIPYLIIFLLNLFLLIIYNLYLYYIYYNINYIYVNNTK